jgi:hypothetical protein
VYKTVRFSRAREAEDASAKSAYAVAAPDGAEARPVPRALVPLTVQV